MSPYRTEAERPVAAEERALPVYAEDGAIAWVWLSVGVILIMTDAWQPGPWGALSSLGMLISGLALVALGRHYVAKWKYYRTSH